MRWSWIASVALVLALSTPAAASLEELAGALPPCALECFMGAIPESSCAPTNQTCFCIDPAFTANVELCVAGSCSTRQALSTKNVTATACGEPVRDRTGAVSITGLAGGGIALVIFALRILARLPCMGGKLGWDDWTMAFTMCLVVPISVMSYVLADLGLGNDMWAVPFDNITRILYIYFIDELLYLAGISLTKVSILCFYLRVFPRRSIRIAIYITIALNIIYIIVFIFITVFQCSPINGAWTRWDETNAVKTGLQCHNVNAQVWAAAAVNMALDILVMILPLRELWLLNLSWRRKAFVLCMFCLGIFVTIVSAIRLESLIVFANTTNLTWDYVRVGYWSTIEIHVGVICACLPALRALLRRIWPTAFGDSKGTTKALSASRGTGTGGGTFNTTSHSRRRSGMKQDDQFVLLEMGKDSQTKLNGT